MVRVVPSYGVQRPWSEKNRRDAVARVGAALADVQANLRDDGDLAGELVFEPGEELFVGFLQAAVGFQAANVDADAELDLVEHLVVGGKLQRVLAVAVAERGVDAVVVQAGR